MRWIERLGLTDLRPGRGDARRLLLLLAVCAICAAMVVDWARAPTDALKAGDVAPRTIKAPFSFKYQDHGDRARRQREARAAVPPVYVHRPDLGEELEGGIADAFTAARAVLAERAVEPAAQELAPAVVEAPAPLDHAFVANVFRSRLGVSVPEADLVPLIDQGFPVEAQQLTIDLLDRAMRGYVITDRSQLPQDRSAIRVIEVRDAGREEYTFTDLGEIVTPSEARQRVTLGLLEAPGEGARWREASAVVARALVSANLGYDHLETEDRRNHAAAAVPMTPVTVKRGTTLFREGDVLTPLQVVQYRALQSARSQHGIALELLAVGLFLFLLFVSLYHFGSSYLQEFSTRVRDVTAVGLLLVLTAVAARFTVASSEGIAALVGNEATASSVWFMLPVAGAAMLVRLLVGVSWTVVFAVAASALCGLVMELQALYVVFFVLSSIAAAGAVEHTRERMAVLRAGLFTGVVNAAAVLLIHFLQLFIAEGEVSLQTTMRPFWSMAFGLVGGLLSGGVVLGLVPLFESVGFVTDYRLMELANLNHPLLRQLMLRAPGTYHHSVIVGSLAEAACEAVGANALQARVAAYFHDIGKGQKPQYFIENQRGGNRHDKLDPYTSAQIIVSHVTEGGRMAKEYRLPKPIVENIYMHHGTGLLQYFYSRALEEADDPSEVDESAFRYPGPKPLTREAGIIMLADKVEAATRTIKEPDEAAIRAMIHKIINSVMSDGQFESCPLTFQEIHTVADTFVKVLLGIYHHRIEYASTAGISRSGRKKLPPVKREAVITLEITPARGTTAEVARAQAARKRAEPVGAVEGDASADYESVEHLPRGK